MKKVLWCLMTAALMTGSPARAEETKNLLVNGNASGGLAGWRNIQKVADDGPNGGKCFEVTGPANIVEAELIPIEPNRAYRFGIWVKSGNEKANQIYIGLQMTDEQKRVINPTSVNALEKGETALTEAVNKGDQMIKVKDASKWETLLTAKRLVVVFEADDSGEYKDLPNYKSAVATKLEKKDEFWEVTFAQPLPFSYPADTKVRAHWASGHNLYLIVTKRVFADWIQLTGTVKPAVKFGASSTSIWPGTRQVQVMIMANHGQKDGEVLKFGDISLEKIDVPQQ